MLPQRPVFSCISVDIFLASFSFRKYLPRLNFLILHSAILLRRFHVPCFLYVPSFAFAPWGKNFWYKSTSIREIWFVT